MGSVWIPCPSCIPAFAGIQSTSATDARSGSRAVQQHNRQQCYALMLLRFYTTQLPARGEANPSVNARRATRP